MSDDRTVHAARADGCEIVRYDRAGKWFLEWPPDLGIQRQRISLARAVDEALMADREPGGYVTLGRYGGGSFGALFRKLSRHASPADRRSRDTLDSTDHEEHS